MSGVGDAVMLGEPLTTALLSKIRLGGIIVESESFPVTTPTGNNMEIGVIAFSVVWCLGGILFMHRTWETYKLRISIMKDDLDLYFRLPSLAQMVFKFWRPLTWFVEQALEDTPEEESVSPDAKLDTSS